ncbi:hypothetical protein ONA91_10820 [Micromonospora sp. DR5-3]|uniref:hypothetical protein n=1 Tax=unclassified Micromonospora TaxID=2617518 RepID=UPI001651D311|nr:MULTISPECIES: hypothetical protein [unclassified Micromonospora]MCW3814947.1 hypothetical protein [Micromonospora sp. DR5-3]
MVSVTRRGAMLIVAAACAAPLLGAVPALAAPPPGALAAGPAPGPAEQSQQQQQPVDLVFVEVTPSTVQPGFLVGIRASCRDNSVPAIVVSDAFGRVQVQPQRGLLTASPMVRERTRPGNYRVKLECPSGQTASTMLQVVKGPPPSRTAAPPSRGPATGFGGTAGIGLGGLLVPAGLALTVAGTVIGVAAARRPRTVRGVARH